MSTFKERWANRDIAERIAAERPEFSHILDPRTGYFTGTGLVFPVERLCDEHPCGFMISSTVPVTNTISARMTEMIIRPSSYYFLDWVDPATNKCLDTPSGFELVDMDAETEEVEEPLNLGPCRPERYILRTHARYFVFEKNGGENREPVGVVTLYPAQPFMWFDGVADDGTEKRVVVGI
ncbi:hypothetical protein EVG20_g10734 [Dentipellis fragilis]|uniref:Uncharacterized protein n=1 Tax=Dentipellis fragilis TaxID=205917 RepID=A0A4Y9XRL3_9AGAM|nr:hypothetical protein EVG20_g10734 [Dentipellis fragilis]